MSLADRTRVWWNPGRFSIYLFLHVEQERAVLPDTNREGGHGWNAPWEALLREKRAKYTPYIYAKVKYRCTYVPVLSSIDPCALVRMLGLYSLEELCSH